MQFYLQQTAEARANVGKALAITGRLPGFDPSLRSSMQELYDNMMNQTPGYQAGGGVDPNGPVDDTTAPLLASSAAALYGNGHPEESLAIARRLYDFAGSRLDDSHVNTYLDAATLVANSCNALGDYDEAEAALTQAIKRIEAAKLRPAHPKTAYATLGLIYYYLQNYADARTNLLHALQLFEAEGDSLSRECATLLANLALTQLQLGDADGARQLAGRSYDILMRSPGTNSRSLVGMVNNLGTIYLKLNDIVRADSLFRRAAAGARERGFEEPYALAAGNLGDISLMRGDVAGARQWFRESLSHAVEARTRRAFRAEYLFTEAFAPGLDDFVEQLRAYDDEEKQSLAQLISALSEREWQDYWRNASQQLVGVNNIGLDRPTCTDGQKLLAYDNALYVKTMLLHSSRVLDGLVAASPNDGVKAAYARAKALKAQITDHATPTDSLPALRARLADCQKLIARKVDFRQALSRGMAAFSDVADALNEHEAAVEFVQTPDFGMGEHGLEMRIWYGALVVRKGYGAPKFVRLCRREALDSLADASRGRFDRRLYDADSTLVFDRVWRPLEALLQPGDTVYFSATGTIGNFSHQALPMGGRRLGEVFDLRRLASTADLPALKRRSDPWRTAVVYGDVNFGEAKADMEREARRYALQPDTTTTAVRGLAERGQWGPLYSSGVEARDVARKLKDMKVSVSLLEGSKASEESFKALDGHAPDVIHISSHGFSFASPSDISEPSLVPTAGFTAMDLAMQGSGILMAGAQNTIDGHAPDGADDGILTAEEISRLDLSATKLVVLSACKTGLGVTDYVDGVFGLQRGFKRAGAGSIVMSLWPVDDRFTQQLMSLFYANLARGQELHRALRSAQQTLRARDADPYYWAAFVILD